jgi:gamma-glutamyl-gamma-aminobutyraldehyde dehydrogenase
MTTIGGSALKPVLLECGGKSPELVFADIAVEDRQAVARAIVANAMMNTGQVCVARSRLYLEAPIYDEMLALITDAAHAMTPGDPAKENTQLGPLASQRQLRTVHSYIEAGLADGGNLILDGRKKQANGAFVGPTVFTGLDEDARMVREEIFGPVLSVARFDSEVEAVTRANASPYALAATVWTTSLRRGHEIPAALNAGMVRVQACAAQNPVGGYAHAGEPAKQSGFGIEGGMLAFESFSRLQSVEMVFGGADPR